MWFLDSRFPALGALVLGLGCADAAPDGLEATAIPPQFNFSNGPAELANVFRFEGIIGGGAIVDPDADLIVWVGLPQDPADASVCGGSEDFDLGDFQLSGLLREIIQALVQAEVHIHVYQLSTFADFCTDTPLAVGFGRFVLNDNDTGVSHTRMNSFGVRLRGPVTLPDGSTVRLSAHARFLIDQDDQFSVASTQVQLSS